MVTLTLMMLNRWPVLSATGPTATGTQCFSLCHLRGGKWTKAPRSQGFYLKGKFDSTGVTKQIEGNKEPA